MEYKQKVIDRLHAQKLEVIEKLHTFGVHVGEHYHIEGVYLQGSQNYNTHHEGSDVDSKLVVVPTVLSMLRDTKLNHELVLENDEHVAVKTVSEFTDLFFKGNINNLEILTTEYAVEEDGSFFKWMRSEDHVEAIAQIVQGTLWDAAIGMMIQKQKSLFRGTVTTQPFVDKHGFDPKDMIHVARIHALLAELKSEALFREALDFSKSGDYPIMEAVRSGNIDAECAKVMVQMYVDSARQMQNDFSPLNSPTLIVSRESIKSSFVSYYMERYT